jgi:hypothetical protein
MRRDGQPIPLQREARGLAGQAGALGDRGLPIPRNVDGAAVRARTFAR